MKSKSGKGPPSADLLVCFPTRAHLTLMPPKSISSPIRPSETSMHHHHRRIRSFGVGQGSSPTLWSKKKPILNTDNSEPTSPKVTCAGQIKVGPKSNSSCKNWQSVMEEIERIHKGKKHKKKKPGWVEALGFKKDVMQFLTCMRNIRFDFRCFGAFPATDIISDEDEDDDEDKDDDTNDDHQAKQVYNEHGKLRDLFRNTGGAAAADNNNEKEEEKESSKPVFSKCFMVLNEDTKKDKTFESHRKSSSDEIIAPPPNALLLMRCRSAPSKSWLEEKEYEEEKEKTEIHYQETKNIEKSDQNVIFRYGAFEHDLYKFSSDIAKETWIVGGIRDSLSRSRSWKS